MTIAPALRKIQAEIAAMLAEPDEIDRDKLGTVARRIGAQAEMIEEGVEG